MMKFKIFLIFILGSVSIFGQGSEVDITNFQYAVRGDENICENRIELLAKFRDSGIEQRIFFTEGQGEGDYVFPDVSQSFFPGIIESLHVVVYTRERRGGRSCGSGEGSVLTIDEYIPVDMDPCDNGFYFKDQRNGGDFEVRHVIAFSWSVKPLVTLSRIGSDIAGYEDFMRATGAPGYNPSVFRWQYQLTNIGSSPNTSNWINIPGVPRGKDLEVKPNSFLNISDIGREIHIRTISCFGSTPSPSISYKLRRSAPHITNNVPEDVLCYDSIDGQVTLTFDRPLDPGDNFNISIVDLSKPDGVFGGVPLFEEVKSFNNVSFSAGNQLVLDGLPSSNALPDGFRVDIIGGGFNGVPYYTEAVDHTLVFEIGRPVPVAFVGEPGADENIVDVWCINGSDGEIALEAIGGIGAAQYYEYLIRSEDEVFGTDWIRFSEQFTHTITGLAADTYYIKIRDANECVAKEQIDIGGGEIRLGEEIVKQVVIEEPDAPVDFEFDLINEPRAFGFEDGRISARVFGGTAFADGTYRFEWKNEAGEVLTTTNTEVLSGDQGFQIILHSVGKGVYKLDVWDVNFDPATDKEGCFFLEAEYSLDEPDPLEVTIDILNPISCNINNEYSNGEDFDFPFEQPDQFQDGALIATVIGGVSFDRSSSNVSGQCRLPLRGYCYNWKKNENGTWVDVLDNNGDKIIDSIIPFQSVGQYALNIVDAEGVELGTYVEYLRSDNSREYRLDIPTDSLKYLPQPAKLELSFKSTPVTCTSGNNGTASVTVSGGTGPYTYSWSTGDEKAEITDLFAGKYNLLVTDARGCEVKGNVSVEQPNGLSFIDLIGRNPTCFEGRDGIIDIRVEGGVKPYTLSWNTGQSTSRIEGLQKGEYILEVTDANKCKAFHKVTLEDPDPIVVDMPEKRALCQDQSYTVDISIGDPGALYSWTSNNGFTSSDSTVEITEAGTYTATITSSLGCIGIGSVDVDVFDTPIDADFLITTQAYAEEEVILVNVSEPIGENVKWTIPEGIEVVSKEDEKLVLKFDEEGAYDILLTSQQGDCFEEFTKTILVQPAIESPLGTISNGDFIEEFIVFPNPNNGSFKTKITLAEDSNISIKIINLMSGMTVHERSEKDNRDFLLDYSINMSSGVYLMLLETPQGSETRKIIFE